jgi:hypothetical protein
MTLDSYRKWLIGTWATGFLVPFVLILIQFGSGKYGGKFSEAIGWLTALTLPTILLMTGVMVANPTTGTGGNGRTKEESASTDITDENQIPKSPNEAKAAHERFIFKLALGVSIVYLLIVNFVFFLEPFTSLKPQVLMRDSKIFLAVFDSVISLMIGYFFGKR